MVNYSCTQTWKCCLVRSVLPEWERPALVGLLEDTCSLPSQRVLRRLKWEANSDVKVVSRVKVIQIIMLHPILRRKAQQTSECSQDYDACQWNHMSWFFWEINCCDIRQRIPSLSPSSYFIIIQCCNFFSFWAFLMSALAEYFIFSLNKNTKYLAHWLRSQLV